MPRLTLNKLPRRHSGIKSTGEDVLDDFLEIACGVQPAERELLLKALRCSGVVFGRVAPAPAISTPGRLVVVLPEFRARECWLYYPCGGRIERRKVIR